MSFLATLSLTFPAAPANADVGGGEFVPVPASRIVDTATGVGGSTAPLGDDQYRDYQILGAAGVPSTGVSAVVVDIAAVSLSGAQGSTLRVYPSGGTFPDSTILRIEQGSRPRSNTVITKVGSNGKIRVFNSSGSTHFNLDVQGYFTTSQDGSGFQPITPTRMVSTGIGRRVPLEQLAPGATYDIQIADTPEVPEGATAIFANVKVSGAEVAGGIRLSKGGVASTAPVTVNYQPDVFEDSGVTVKLSDDGRIRVTNVSSTATVDVFIDVQGYFLNGPQVSGGTFTPLDGVRIYDTANSTPLPAGGTRTVTVANLGGLPAASQMGAVALTLFVGDWNSTGSIRLYPADVAEPGASNLSFNTNSNPAAGLSTTSITGVSATGAVKITNTSSGPVRVLLNAQGWFSKRIIDPVIAEIMALEPTATEASVVAMVQDIVDESAAEGTPITFDDAKLQLRDSYTPVLDPADDDPADDLPEVDCLSEPIDSPTYCLPASYEAFDSTDSIEGTDMTVAAVGQALDSGNVEGAEAFVETRSETKNDAIQDEIENLLTDGVPEDAAVDPRIYPRSTTTAAAGANPYGDRVVKHLKWTVTSSSGCTCTSRVVQDVRIEQWVGMPFGTDPNILLRTKVDVDVIYGSPIRVESAECKIVHVELFWDHVVRTWGGCPKWLVSWSSSNFLTTHVLTKLYNGTRGRDHKYHQDVELKINPTGSLRAKNVTLTTRNWQYPSGGGFPTFL